MKSKKSNKYFPLNITLVGLSLAFIVLGVFAHRNAYFGYDIAISRATQSIHNPLFSILMNVVSEIGEDLNMGIIVVLATSLLFLAGLKTEAIKTALLTTASSITGTLIKRLVNRPRPTSELVTIQESLNDKSFPSLHVLIFTVFFGYMFYLSVYKLKIPWLRSMITTFSLVLILTIGISRVYLGAHWASDTLGGYLLGAIFLTIAIKISRRFPTKTK